MSSMNSGEDLYSYSGWRRWQWFDCLEITGIPEDFSVAEFKKEFEKFWDADLYIFSGNNVILEAEDERELKKILFDLETCMDTQGNPLPFIHLKDRRCTVIPACVYLTNLHEFSLSRTLLIINHVPYLQLTEEEVISAFNKYSVKTMWWPPVRSCNESIAYIVSTEKGCEQILREKSSFFLRNGEYMCTVKRPKRLPALTNRAPCVHPLLSSASSPLLSLSPPPVPVGITFTPEEEEERTGRGAWEREGREPSSSSESPLHSFSNADTQCASSSGSASVCGVEFEHTEDDKKSENGKEIGGESEAEADRGVVLFVFSNADCQEQRWKKMEREKEKKQEGKTPVCKALEIGNEEEEEEEELEARVYRATEPFLPPFSHRERYHILRAGDCLEYVCAGPTGWVFCRKNGGGNVRLCPEDRLK